MSILNGACSIKNNRKNENADSKKQLLRTVPKNLANEITGVIKVD